MMFDAHAIHHRLYRGIDQLNNQNRNDDTKHQNAFYDTQVKTQTKTMAMASITSSCLIAASCLNAALKPFAEYPVALMMRFKPVFPGLPEFGD